MHYPKFTPAADALRPVVALQAEHIERTATDFQIWNVATTDRGTAISAQLAALRSRLAALRSQLA